MRLTSAFKLTFLFLFLSNIGSFTCWAAQRPILDQLEASVNSSIILLSDVKKFREVEKLRSQLDPLFVGTALASQGSQATDADIVDFLIDERLITQQFPKTDDEVEKEISSIQNSNHLTKEGLREAISREGFKYLDYFELIRVSGSKRDLIDRDIRTKVTISDDDLENYFKNHYARSNSVPRAFHIQAISVSDRSFKGSSHAAVHALAQKSATEALKAIQGGESFAEVAKRVSDDSSAASGGDLGELSEDQMSPLFREHIKELKVGEVSGLIAAPSGDRFYILKLLNVKSDESDRMEKMKEEMRSQLAAKEYQHQIALWLDRQRQSAFIHKGGQPAIQEIPIQK